MANEGNVFNNLFKIILGIKRDNDSSVQVVESKNKGLKLYYKPDLAQTIGSRFSGMFFPDRKNAMIFSGFEEAVKDKSIEEILLSVPDSKIDAVSFVLMIDPKTGMVSVGSNGSGKYMNEELLKEFVDEAIDLLSQPDFTFYSIREEGAIDYQFDPGTEEDLIENALSFFHYVDRDWNNTIYTMTSPMSGEETYFWVFPYSKELKSTGAKFMVYPTKENRDEAIYRNEHPYSTRNEENDGLLVEVYPKGEKLKICDNPIGKSQELSEEERRNVVKNFLTILKDVYNYGINS